MVRIVVAGGGVCGLAAAMMLGDAGHEVVVVERDPQPPPPDPASAANWDRRSIGQFTLAHWLHARGTRVLESRVPDVYRLLAEHGGFRFNLVSLLLSLQPGAEADPADRRFDQLTGRRSTLEWAMATGAERHEAVTVRRGEAIAGLVTGAEVAAGVPHVTGVRLQSGEEITGTLVVDATGRRSPTPQWLEAIGARPPHEEAEDSGFAYFGRYFRSADGSVPAIIGPLLAPYGSFSILTLPADNGTWSVTLYALADDKPLRRFRDPEVHARVVRECPMQAHWIDGEPITEMASMVGVVDRHRRFVVDGKPCATGLLSVADASSCTNPSLGRGISFGLMHAGMLADTVATHLGDPLALSLAFDEVTETQMKPWHDSTTAIDRRRCHEMRTLLTGGEPDVEPAERIGLALAAAAARDPVCARAFAEIFTCTSLASDVFARPGLLGHVLEVAGPEIPPPPPGPDRAHLLELVS